MIRKKIKAPLFAVHNSDIEDEIEKTADGFTSIGKIITLQVEAVDDTILNAITSILKEKKVRTAYVVDKSEVIKTFTERERLQKENAQLRKENEEWRHVFNVCNDREFRKRFNELIQKEQNDSTCVPDFDEVYKRFFKLKARSEDFEAETMAIMNDYETLAGMHHKVLTENSSLKKLLKAKKKGFNMFFKMAIGYADKIDELNAELKKLKNEE